MRDDYITRLCEEYSDDPDNAEILSVLISRHLWRIGKLAAGVGFLCGIIFTVIIVKWLA
jgi:hypothetical protein